MDSGSEKVQVKPFTCLVTASNQRAGTPVWTSGKVQVRPLTCLITASLAQWSRVRPLGAKPGFGSRFPRGAVCRSSPTRNFRTDTSPHACQAA